MQEYIIKSCKIRKDTLPLPTTYILSISSLIPLSAHSALLRSESLCPFVEGNSPPFLW